MNDLNHSRTLAAGLLAAGLLLASACGALADVHYVDVNSTNATPPYTNWSTAATNIQDAVNAAIAGDDIVVANGIYGGGGGAIDGVANRVAVDKPLSLRSVNGPQSTFIDGGQSNRCVYLSNGATLSGFTLTNGNAGNPFRYGTGGGVYGGTLNNCTLSGNTAEYNGGASDSTLNNCLLIGNAALDGGGAGSSTLNNCTLSNNSAASYACCTDGNGGGASNCTLNNCTLNDNVASGARVANSGFSGGGGAFASTLNNCTLTGNRAVGSFNAYALGGGAFRCTLNNCTVSGNSAGFGGGASASALNNCILYSNTASYAVGANYHGLTTLNHSCTTPLPTSGIGNITNAPLFVELASRNLRLQSNSPCINAGKNSFAITATDLDGNPRIVNGSVDMGAYEFQSPASIAPQLTITSSGANSLLSWTTNYVGFDFNQLILESATNVSWPVLWSAVSLAGSFRGQLVVTNGVGASRQFYRLRVKTP